MGNFTGKTWTNHRIEWLKKLWAAGHTAAQIAAIMGNGITRNSVIGAARRAGCAPRQSPITRLTDEQRANRPRYRHPHPAVITIEVNANGETKRRGRPQQQPVLTSVRGGDPIRASLASQTVLARQRFEQPTPAPAVKPAPVMPREPKPTKNTAPWDGKQVPFNKLQPGQCKWIEGATVRWHADEAMACTAPTVPERPYCQHHCDSAAGKVRVSSDQSLDHLAAVDEAGKAAA